MIMILVISTISLFEVDKEKLVSVSATSMYVEKTNILDLNLGFRCPNLPTDNGRQSIR